MVDFERYSRQILYKNIGQQGQAQLLKQHVLIIGMGALGTHLAESLVRTGVGEITIVDRIISNLVICNARLCLQNRMLRHICLKW